MAVLLLLGGPALGNDIVFLGGQVHLKDGSAPGKAVEIKLDCKGADHAVRQTVTDKKGKFNLKVERDEFDHVARALPATETDIGGDALAGSCSVIAVLPGFTSSSIPLGSLKIGKDLRLPDLVLTKSGK